jgi:hypothetical protein
MDVDVSADSEVLRDAGTRSSVDQRPVRIVDYEQRIMTPLHVDQALERSQVTIHAEHRVGDDDPTRPRTSPQQLFQVSDVTVTVDVHLRP